MHMGKGKSMRQYDVVVIGAGVSGSAVARELSRKERRIAVLEKACDVCEGTSKANSGIVHAGYDAVPGTLKAKLNVLGNERMESLSKELDFSFKRNGSLVLCFEEEGIPKLEELYERGLKNGVKGRTRAGMGRCQAGFCSPRVVEILARELSVDEAQITKAGGDSYFLTGYDKEKYLEGKTDSCEVNEEKIEKAGNTGEVRA